MSGHSQVSVGIIDLGIGTWASQVNIIRYMGYKVETVMDPIHLSKFTHVILPGVGNFAKAAEKLNSNGWRESIKGYAENGSKLLGVCLGMQLLGKSSEEGPGVGLGVLDFNCRILDSEGLRRVPNIGWGQIQSTQDHPLLRDLGENARFYFSHSYSVPAGLDSTVGTTEHNSIFSSAISRDNVSGVQFHPEKSHRYGMRLLENFLNQAG